MAERTDAILAAAERRLREGGYNGFGMRELAGDVGIRNASIHHHFATKSALAAAVARRYAARVLAEVEAVPPPARLAALRGALRRVLAEDGRMCLAGMMAAEVDVLPREVAGEARAFFERAAALVAEGLEPVLGDRREAEEAALRALALLEGALLLARSLGDIEAFDRAARRLL